MRLDKLGHCPSIQAFRINTPHPLTKIIIVSTEEDRKGFDEKFFRYKTRMLFHLEGISELSEAVAKKLLDASKEIADHLKEYDPYKQSKIFEEAIASSQAYYDKNTEKKVLESEEPDTTVAHSSVARASSASSKQTLPK